MVNALKMIRSRAGYKLELEGLSATDKADAISRYSSELFVFLNDLYGKKDNPPAFGSQAWWSADVIFELVNLQIVDERDLGVSGVQDSKAVDSLVEEKKKKFDAEQEARTKFIMNKRQKEMEKEAEDKNIKQKLFYLCQKWSPI